MHGHIVFKKLCFSNFFKGTFNLIQATFKYFDRPHPLYHRNLYVGTVPSELSFNIPLKTSGDKTMSENEYKSGTANVY
jgi:predicted AlkP superfamily phosphohydrolase/phosphomutase